MKIQLLTTACLCLGTNAFAPQPQPAKVSALEGQKNSWMHVGAAATLGLTLASQVAFAAPPMTSTVDSIPSIVVSTEALDFALPSYDGIGKNVGGFGQGTEARLTGTNSMTDPGGNEKAKQAEAMRKAEEARLERKKASKAAKMERNEDIIREAAQKKKADAEKMKAFMKGDY